jgi:TatD DNase family protein
MSSSASPSPFTPSNYSFIDIGANLLDDRYLLGSYRGVERHPPDIDQVVQRAIHVGVTRILLTAGTLEESRRALQLARDWNRLYHPDIRFHSTVGIHPTRCQQEFVDNNEDQSSSSIILEKLLELAKDGQTDGTVVAIGEIGLDYDRLEFCSREIQREYLRKQLQALVQPTGLPLFLHNRNVNGELLDILRLEQDKDCWNNAGCAGVVHSFDDSIELANEFITHGFYIGLNGCSLRTEANLATVRQLPLDRIVLETDCPYCDIRPTHAGYQYLTETTRQLLPASKPEKKYERGLLVKNRQEPCHILQVAEIVAGCKELSLEQVAAACLENTNRLFQFE